MRPRPAGSAILAGAILSIILSACAGGGSSAAPSPADSAAGSSPPAASSTASPSPTPTPTADTQALLKSAVAMLRDPEVAVSFILDADKTIGGRSFDHRGTVVIVGPDLDAATTIPELDVDVGQRWVDGANYLRVGDSHWVRDDAMPAPVPALADAFPGAIRAGATEKSGSGDQVLTRVDIEDADLQAFLAATGQIDSNGTVSEGALALYLDATGALSAIEVKAVVRTSPALDEESIHATFAVDSIGTTADPDAPSVTAPNEYWLRAVSDLGFVIDHPRDWTRERRDVGGTVGESFSMTTGTGLIVQLRPAGSKDTLDSLVATSKKEMGYEVTEVTDYELGGEPAKALSFRVDDAAIPIRAVRYIALHDGTVVFITWASPIIDLPTTLPILGEMVQSFQI